ncbi:MAG: SpoIID/LytB domain-containing protein [Candidatus Marinimicrobia bacterium]|nr:SpoIID/LytB domain-containing protein [Candidatus Neomarinimicrobiota bacterium]MCF7840000.1 SpoIID/LytB domain-containing protein [Candidatus Neomarinimicrobiota bacterium]MCF7903417.1 SpoIID/LytB domain-containing protein [Candidatus Neomarinimicrobiota bacterium]
MPISTGLNSRTIRIGIILPEDKTRRVKLSWPADLAVASSHDFDDHITQIALEIEDGKFRLNLESEQVVVDDFMLASGDNLAGLSAEHGVCVDSVVAGRGFHWEKQIQPILPGRLLFSIVDDAILLINELSVESYVACVATSEMGAAAPDALLAAQTIVARCWALASVERKHADLHFDVCNDDCCQRYQGTTYLTDHSLQAAIATENQVLVYENSVIDARYSKNCGGIVEDYTTVWGEPPVPYLIPLWDGPNHPEGFAQHDLEPLLAYQDAYCSATRFQDVDLPAMLGKVDETGSYYRWEVAVEKRVILNNLKRNFNHDWAELFEILVLKRGASGRISHLRLAGENQFGDQVTFDLRSEYNIRRTFSESFLYSSAFVIENLASLEEDDAAELRGAGWGHGVGMCQMGALGMALDGIPYQDILSHYYPGTTLKNLTDEIS